MKNIKDILAKETLTEADINYLVANKASVPEKELVRLGLASADKAVKEPVNSEAKSGPSGEAKAAAEAKVEEESGDEKRGRGRPRSL